MIYVNPYSMLLTHSNILDPHISILLFEVNLRIPHERKKNRTEQQQQENKIFFILLKFNNIAINLYLKRADDNSNF